MAAPLKGNDVRVISNDSARSIVISQPINNLTEDTIMADLQNNIKVEESILVYNTGGIVIGVVTILLNMSVIISVLRIPKTSKFYVTYILLGNLAFTDAGTGLWVVVLNTISLYHGRRKEFLACVNSICRY